MHNTNNFIESIFDRNSLILNKFQSKILFNKLEDLREYANKSLSSKHWAPVLSGFSEIDSLIQNKLDFDFTSKSLDIGTSSNGEDLKELFDELLEKLIPWRKGPLNVFDTFVDAEWQSDLKWDRIKDHLGELEHKNILDIGCNNGYYLFKMLNLNPRFILGIDPSERCFFQFELIRRYIENDSLLFELFGVEDIDIFNELFDVILCMGVLYHRRDPLLSLRKMWGALKPGGRVLVETLSYPIDGSFAFCVPDRYAQMHNVFLIPSKDALISWLKKSGFKKCEIVSEVKITNEEQRKTKKFAPYLSLDSFLDPDNNDLTIEGHPAPIRTTAIAFKA
ncbi:UNVERIFIED_CONTAM: hypothetical protein GTU68_031394 [Idotea baltica]|nr:hypothetical protein [Idotea baltica]